MSTNMSRSLSEWEAFRRRECYRRKKKDRSVCSGHPATPPTRQSFHHASLSIHGHRTLDMDKLILEAWLSVDAAALVCVHGGGASSWQRFRFKKRPLTTPPCVCCPCRKMCPPRAVSAAREATSGLENATKHFERNGHMEASHGMTQHKTRNTSLGPTGHLGVCVPRCLSFSFCC